MVPTPDSFMTRPESQPFSPCFSSVLAFSLRSLQAKRTSCSVFVPPFFYPLSHEFSTESYSLPDLSAASDRLIGASRKPAVRRLHRPSIVYFKAPVVGAMMTGDVGNTPDLLRSVRTRTVLQLTEMQKYLLWSRAEVDQPRMCALQTTVTIEKFYHFIRLRRRIWRQDTSSCRSETMRQRYGNRCLQM